MTTANRGKSAESALSSLLSKLSAKHSDFCIERIADAYSSRGALATPRAGDFVVYTKGKNFLIELKEVKHDFRLPKPNFKRDQRARMKVRQLAGSICFVLVHHSTTDTWRDIPLDYFGTEETGSWDLSSFPTINLNDIVEKLCR